MSATPPLYGPVNVFFSYSHEDEELKERLVKHLSILQRAGAISGWHDRRITAGQEWKGVIDSHLDTAELILLLVSADFLASDYCYDIEVGRAMERHQAGEACVIPVILRPCSWESAPFGKLHALPRDARPVTTWSNKDQAFQNIAEGVRAAVNEMAKPQRQTADNDPLEDKSGRTSGRTNNPARKGAPKRAAKKGDAQGVIVGIEFWFDRSPESFSEQQLKAMLRDVFGVNIEKIRIVSIQRGSVKVLIEGDAKELARIVEAYRSSARLRWKLGQTDGLLSLTYTQGEREHIIHVTVQPGDTPNTATAERNNANTSSSTQVSSMSQDEIALGPLQVFGPLQVLREAIAAVPAVKFALGVAGMAAAVAIVAGFSLDYKVAVLGTIIMLGLMYGLVVFSSAVGRGAVSTRPLAFTLSWTFVILISATSLCIFTSFFFSWPKPLEAYVGEQAGPKPSPTPTVQPTIRITLIPPYDPIGGPTTSTDIKGEVSGVSPKDFSVVIYSYTDAWYVQPTTAESKTPIEADGKWSQNIRTGAKYAALLVRNTFEPSPKISQLPGVGGSVIDRQIVEGQR